LQTGRQQAILLSSSGLTTVASESAALIQVIAVDINAILGCAVVAAAIGLITYLLLRSRRSIERIARNGFGSVREIHKELDTDR